MKKILFFVFLLFSLSFSHFSLDHLNINITLNENGSAFVRESYSLIIYGNFSMEMYKNGLDENTFEGWQNILKDSIELKTHINQREANITNLILKPQPMEPSYTMPGIWYGEIILDYNVNPYFINNSIKNNTGIVFMDNYKPRVTRYKLNNNVFSFKRTDKGSIILDKKTKLTFILPNNAKILESNPKPTEVNNDEVTWQNLILNNFILEYEIEIPLDKEIEEYFKNLQKNFESFIYTQNGLASLVILAIFSFAYFYFKKVKR